MSSDKAELFAGYWRMLEDDEYNAPVREYRFAALACGGVGKGVRQRLSNLGWHDWRFDFAWPDDKVAVEIDGNAWHTRGGGRHSQDDDKEKGNLAISLGWRVFHFSPQMLERDPQACIYQVDRLLSVI